MLGTFYGSYDIASDVSIKMWLGPSGVKNNVVETASDEQMFYLSYLIKFVFEFKCII